MIEHSMSKLIIGCGYLGKRVAAAWLQQGHAVTALTRSQKNADALATLGITPVVGDILQPETLKNLPAVDTLLYAVGFDRTTGHSQREVYVNGLDNVLNTLGKDIHRLIYISSTSVYGQQDGSIVDANSPTNPAPGSGKVCLEAEQTVWNNFGQRHLNKTCIILRSAGIYGPDRLLRRIESLKQQEPITGNPDSWLNLVHVEDLSKAVLALESASNVSGKTYLACDDRPIHRREYYELLATLSEAPPPIFESAAETTTLGKRCSNIQLKTDTAWQPVYSDILTGLPAAIAARNP